jgi:sugar phosphate isomerase/epimerase
MALPIALQLYSVRQDCEKDLPGVLAAVKKMGYDGVEFAGYYGRSADELKTLLDDNGLKTAGSHLGIQTLLGDDLERTMDFNQTIGNKFLIVPGLPGEYTNSRDAWLKTARIFNEISDKVTPRGFQTGYHNHHTEFKALDGELPWDTFFGNTKKEVVMQFDTGNAMHGGADAIPFLERYPGRATTVHLKEFSPANEKALIGEGDIPWQRIFDLCESSAGTEWYIVEQESYAYPPMECVDRCLQNLRKMGK